MAESISTGTTAGAKAHARAQEGTVVSAAPTRPASEFANLPTGVEAQNLSWAEVIAGGNYSHRAVTRGTNLRLTDLHGDACAHILVYNSEAPFERLNVADTVKVQWQVYASAGYLLLSDQGRVLASVISDTSLHHDTIYGTSTKARNEKRYGSGEAFGPTPAGRELFTLAAAKNGLTRTDVAPSVSFFKGLRVDDSGSAVFTGSAGAGTSVTLRFEMPAIVLIANTAHPLDPRPDFNCTELEVVAWQDCATTPNDPLWSTTPEGRRAFTNTLDYLNAKGRA